MTHKCFQCDQRFKTSGQMVRHMQEAHQSFVQDAKDKIDRSKEQYVRSFVNTAATCPYCQMDCHTRKKLMRHLEDHKDLEPEAEEETELKIYEITNENKKSLLDQFEGEKASSSGASTSGAVNTSGNPNFVQNLIHALETDPAKIASSKIKVSSTSLKLPERRYKCFWCDTSFRKRGKLMDHIDMFHKANKHQSELEAELLQGVSRDMSAHEIEKTKPATTTGKQNTNSSMPASNSKTSGYKDAGGVVHSKSCEKPVTQSTQPPKPKRKCCTFNMVGTIRESPRVGANTKSTPEHACKFYFGSCGNLPIKEEKPVLSKSIRSPSPTQFTESESSLSQLSSHPNKPRSKINPDTQPFSSPQAQVSAAPIPNFDVRDTPFPAATRSLRRASQQLSATAQPVAQSLFPHIPYYLPASDLYLNQQHNMIIEQQRSQLQYLSYMQSLVQNTVDPNRPLDLSKANYN